MTQKTQTQTFQTLEAAATWAIEAVDEGRLDRGELYDFIKDALGGNDMAHWLDEDAIRKETAENIGNTH
ncbi:hypothetical protein [Agrobacterium rosae]|uniref:hypothetical protein n=1 Tax=Agrobacterium rosae TaxID=1972867 RepID=UPI0011AF975C|nr:hypothetical protein [Agrobacterium rosae]